MVFKKILLILILPFFLYAQWTDPRPKSIQLWHLNTSFFDSLGNVVRDSVAALAADGVTVLSDGTLKQKVFGSTSDLSGVAADSNGTAVFVKQFGSSGVGGGIFYWYSSGYSANNITVFAGSSGYFVRDRALHDNIIDIRDAGASTSISDNSTAIQSVIDLAATLNYKVYIPSGIYQYATTLDISGNSYSGLEIIGAGKDNAVLKYTGTSEAIISDNTSIDAPERIVLRDLTIQGQAGAKYGIRYGWAGRWKWENVKFSTFDSSAVKVITDVWSQQFDFCLFYDTNIGLHFGVRTNLWGAYRCDFENMDSVAVYMPTNTVGKNFTMLDCNFQTNPGVGVKLDAMSGIRLINCYFESNDTRDLVIGDTSGTFPRKVSIENCYFNFSSGAETYGAWVSGGKNIRFVNNFMSYNGNSEAFIKVDSTCIATGANTLYMTVEGTYSHLGDNLAIVEYGNKKILTDNLQIGGGDYIKRVPTGVSSFREKWFNAGLTDSVEVGKWDTNGGFYIYQPQDANAALYLRGNRSFFGTGTASFSSGLTVGNNSTYRINLNTSSNRTDVTYSNAANNYVNYSGNGIHEVPSGSQYKVNLPAAGTEFIVDETYVSAKQYRLNSLNTAPASASDTGVAGEIRVDADYIYICTATNTWKRVAISTW